MIHVMVFGKLPTKATVCGCLGSQKRATRAFSPSDSEEVRNMLPPTRHREPQWPSKGDGSRNTFLSAPPTPRATSGLFWKVLLALGSTALLLCSPYVLGYGNTHRYVIDGAVSIIDSMGSQPLWPKECASMSRKTPRVLGFNAQE